MTDIVRSFLGMLLGLLGSSRVALVVLVVEGPVGLVPDLPLLLGILVFLEGLLVVGLEVLQMMGISLLDLPVVEGVLWGDC